MPFSCYNALLTSGSEPLIHLIEKHLKVTGKDSAVLSKDIANVYGLLPKFTGSSSLCDHHSNSPFCSRAASWLCAAMKQISLCSLSLRILVKLLLNRPVERLTLSYP